MSTENKDLLNIQNTTRDFSGEENLIEIGQWYWVKRDSGNWLGCITNIGSNFVNLSGPSNNRDNYSTRIHIDDFKKETTPEKEPTKVIKNYINTYKTQLFKHIQEVKELSQRLGVSNLLSIDLDVSEATSTALVLSNQQNIKDYEKALILAKDKGLPELFEAIKKSSNELNRWMGAESLPLQAQIEKLKNIEDQINDRIFNVSLYAGLTEDVIHCHKGSPADKIEKLHVMQRQLYMDEECLLDYRTGGMDFHNLNDFDGWLSQDTNLNRVLPFPRCIVSMRVRRDPKDRDWDGSIRHLLKMEEEANLDKLTFLYIRNGENLYRMDCELDFGEMIFPDKEMFNLTQPMMVKMFANSFDKMITLGEYEERIKKAKENKKNYEKWIQDNPKEEWINQHPYDYDFEREYRWNDWKPFDRTNIYYDECLADINNRIKKYNRIALIIQGLFDRTEILHPHNPVKSWTSERFDEAIKLVYDGSNVLTYGQAPDFEEYRAFCNSQITIGSVVVGQDNFWQLREGEKESARLAADWRNKSEYRPKYFKPYGDPGPGYLAFVKKIKSNKIFFTWNRERRTYSRWDRDPIETHISVPISELFNISAYKKGEMKKFYEDPRTRSKYLKWAPFLMAAEDYLVGKLGIEG